MNESQSKRDYSHSIRLSELLLFVFICGIVFTTIRIVGHPTVLMCCLFPFLISTIAGFIHGGVVGAAKFGMFGILFGGYANFVVLLFK